MMRIAHSVLHRWPVVLGFRWRHRFERNSTVHSSTAAAGASGCSRRWWSHLRALRSAALVIGLGCRVVTTSRVWEEEGVDISKSFILMCPEEISSLVFLVRMSNGNDSFWELLLNTDRTWICKCTDCGKASLVSTTKYIMRIKSIQR